mmetsp:Transcript_6809/g.16080  ORF Transcript_6809/g.16080 Transcript_6809/m.16080 type:complete len:603 (-) Transcript_6809:128-1936(-)
MAMSANGESQARQSQAAPRPPLLQETFTINCPVHGQMYLPQYVKLVVDTFCFQRMRFIKQLGICANVYPGATHNRFFHSIGTAYLAYEFIKNLRRQHPELQISDRDEVCVTLAGLCHDLGHPCYSHMFESFLHQLGKEKRKMAGQYGKPLPAQLEASIRKYETWSHEKASQILVVHILERLQASLELAGLRRDKYDDFILICELIDPPKKELHECLRAGTLKEKWPELIKGRPVEKAFLYEIVSNWRSGIDVDKFDYFRRDAHFLGLQRQFDHVRYMKSARVILDSDREQGVPTISPPEKDRDNIRDNLMELRKTLHRTAYQHKTVKKLEQHMIDILKLLDKTPFLTGSSGQKLTMSQAALDVDLVAYPKLTDMAVESRLLEAEEDFLQEACKEYQLRFLQRKIMRNVIIWTLSNEEENPRFQLPEEDDYLARVLTAYATAVIQASRPNAPEYEVTADQLRLATAKLNYGMGHKDPVKNIIFHDKQLNKRGYDADPDANPHRTKLFLFWNPPNDLDPDICEATLHRLTTAASTVASDLNGDALPDTTPASPMKPKRASATSLDNDTLDAKPPPAKKSRRMLKVQSSCPDALEGLFGKLEQLD